MEDFIPEEFLRRLNKVIDVYKKNVTNTKIGIRVIEKCTEIVKEKIYKRISQGDSFHIAMKISISINDFSYKWVFDTYKSLRCGYTYKHLNMLIISYGIMLTQYEGSLKKIKNYTDKNDDGSYTLNIWIGDNIPPYNKIRKLHR